MCVCGPCGIYVVLVTNIYHTVMLWKCHITLCNWLEKLYLVMSLLACCVEGNNGNDRDGHQ